MILKRTAIVPFILFAALAAWFVTIATSHAAPLKIGIHDKPPFAMKSEGGEWSGLAVDVWKNVAKNAGITYELVEVPFEEIRAGIIAGRLDAAVGEIAVTADDQKLLDFTQPYLISQIGVALPIKEWNLAWLEAIREFFNWSVAQFLTGIFAAMLLVSVLIWLFERGHHTGHFRGGIDGIGSALWFAAVTMTTVGYGDKTPATALGRFVAICWMFVGVLLVSAFTATVASSMAAARINSSISQITDFHHLHCGVLKGSMVEKLAQRLGINTSSYETLEEALRELSQKKIQAVVAEKISLNYLRGQMVKESPKVEFSIPELTIRSSFLAIPIQKNHPDFARINESLLDLTGSNDWEPMKRRWLGAGQGGL